MYERPYFHEIGPVIERDSEIIVNFHDHPIQVEGFWRIALKYRSGAQPATVAFEVAIFSVRANFFEICAVRVTSKIREPVLKLLSILLQESQLKFQPKIRIRKLVPDGHLLCPSIRS